MVYPVLKNDKRWPCFVYCWKRTTQFSRLCVVTATHSINFYSFPRNGSSFWERQTSVKIYLHLPPATLKFHCMQWRVWLYKDFSLWLMVWPCLEALMETFLKVSWQEQGSPWNLRQIDFISKLFFFLPTLYQNVTFTYYCSLDINTCLLPQNWKCKI